MGSKDKIRSFFEANVGKVVTTQQIRKVAGVSEYARRLREHSAAQRISVEYFSAHPSTSPRFTTGSFRSLEKDF